MGELGGTVRQATRDASVTSSAAPSRSRLLRIGQEPLDGRLERF